MKQLAPDPKPPPRPQTVCRICGTGIEPDRTYCALCTPGISKDNLADVARSGRIAAQSPEAQARRAATKHRHNTARAGWLASSLPAWLNNEAYTQKIRADTPISANIVWLACRQAAQLAGISKRLSTLLSESSPAEML
jgi:hypothetical protein